MRRKSIYVLFLMLFAVLSVTVTAQVDPGTANLTHSWTFTDGTANDRISDAHGTLMGAAEIYDGSLLVVEPGSFLELPADKIAINTYKAVTIEAWFKSVPSGNPQYTMLANFGDTQNDAGVNSYFICAARGDDKSRAAISCGTYTNPWSGESGANGPEYDDGEVHQMVSTLDSANITLYIDGILQATTPVSAKNRIDSISTVHAYLGKSGYNGDSTWIGEILEFNMYNKTLLAEEIMFLFERGGTNAVSNRTANLPEEYALLQNYPNPFNPTTTIEFALPRRSNVRLVLVDMMGKIVRELAEGDYMEGIHQVKLDASDLASGIYFCRMQAGNFVDAKKVMLVK